MALDSYIIQRIFLSANYGVTFCVVPAVVFAAPCVSPAASGHTFRLVCLLAKLQRNTAIELLHIFINSGNSWTVTVQYIQITT